MNLSTQELAGESHVPKELTASSTHLEAVQGNAPSSLPEGVQHWSSCGRDVVSSHVLLYLDLLLLLLLLTFTAIPADIWHRGRGS